MLKAIIKGKPERISEFTAVFVEVVSGSLQNGRVRNLKLVEAETDEKSLETLNCSEIGDKVVLDVREAGKITGFYNVSKNLGLAELKNAL